tara:strand:- start:397 stop:600 length:204 start_codon:yes stop_codon:yes gene_type:complete
MAKPIKKISDKLIKINDSLTINLYDNGYMVEVSGRNAADDWTQVKITCNTLEEVNTLIKEANEIDKV